MVLSFIRCAPESVLEKRGCWVCDDFNLITDRKGR